MPPTPVTIDLPLSVRPSVCPSVRHNLRYRVCVINSSHSFQLIFLKPCILVVDIFKTCIWIFDVARIKFDRKKRPFKLSRIWQVFCLVGYGICVIIFSYNFQWINMKLYMFVVDILKMCMWVFDGARIKFVRIMAF